MIKYFVCILLVTNSFFACEDCYKDYIEKEIYAIDEEIDDMILDQSENILYFFYLLGRAEALEDLKEVKCDVDLQ